MKAIMNPGWLAGLFVVLAMASCTGATKKPVQITSEDVSYKTADVDINGKWYIESIVSGDSAAIRPYGMTAGAYQYFEFADSTYDITTNCCVFHGSLTINGDSIRLDNGMMIEEAVCEDMTTEEALRRILPEIVTVGVENDSTVRLNSATPSEYIRLRKCGTGIK